MNELDYRENVLKTESKTNVYLKGNRALAFVDTLHNVVTVGKQAEDLKKHIFYGKPIDIDDSSELRYELYFLDPLSRLIHAILGMITESAELGETLLRFIETGVLDRVNLKEEAGDLEWYVELFIDAMQTSREEIRSTNIAKLSKRYPGQKFTKESAMVRDVKNELSHIEK